MVSVKKTIHAFAVALALLAALALIIYMSLPEAPPDLPERFSFELADTPAERELGLSGRMSLADDTGLLFVFPQADIQSFWMKDMYMAIDILWLADDGTVVGIEKGVTPETFPETFHPPVPVRYVLEVAAGVAEKQGWDVGARVPLP